MGLLVPVPALGSAFKLVQMLVLEVTRLWVLGGVYTLALLNIIFSTNLFTSHTNVPRNPNQATLYAEQYVMLQTRRRRAF